MLLSLPPFRRSLSRHRLLPAPPAEPIPDSTYESQTVQKLVYISILYNKRRCPLLQARGKATSDFGSLPLPATAWRPHSQNKTGCRGTSLASWLVCVQTLRHNACMVWLVQYGRTKDAGLKISPRLLCLRQRYLMEDFLICLYFGGSVHQ